MSTFERRLEKEVKFREGKVLPPTTPPPGALAAFDQDIPLTEAHRPVFEQKLQNFRLMEGADVTFVCKVDAHPMPQVQAKYNFRL